MVRDRLLNVHRWLGLIVGPFLFLQILTGSFLVASDLATDPAPRPNAAAMARMTADIEAALPGHRLTRLYAPAGRHNAFAELINANGSQTYAEIAPAKAPQIRSGPLWHFPYRAAVQLHYRLASGTGGMVLVCLTGLAMALLGIFGLLVWWPGLAGISGAFKPASSLPARLRLRQRHRTVGALVSAIALFSSATGLMLIIPDILAAQSVKAAAVQPAAAKPAILHLETALNAAQGRFPDAAIRDVRFPLADRIDVNLHAPERNARAVHVVSVRLSDGAVIKALPARDNPVLWMKILPLHTGQSLGWMGGMLLLAEACALAFLIWAGTRLWLSRRRKAK